MTSVRSFDCDVIIVGGGPVGLGLAIDLGQRGVEVILVEKYQDVHQVPKGQNLTQRTGEHFKAWGCQKEIRAASPISHDYGIAGMVSYGNLLSGYNYDWLRRGNVREFYAADNERLPQYDTERVLRERAARLDCVKTLFGWPAVGIEQDQTGATVTIRQRDGNDTQKLTGQFVVGCDGSRSMVREALGMQQHLDQHDKRMVLLVFDSVRLHELLERFPGKCYFNAIRPGLEGYWLFFGRVDLGRRWFFHAPVPMDTTAENFNFDEYLHEAVGESFPVNYHYVGFWDLRFAYAKTYRCGRVFIAGDSAHSHPPYGGYGINTGLEDARNLSWKLAAELQGWAGSGLLDSYSLERQPVFASTARDFIKRFIAEDREFVQTYNPDKDLDAFESAWESRAATSSADVTTFEPNYEGSPIVFGPDQGRCSAVGSHEYKARAGHHLAPQPLLDGSNVFDVLGSGFTLLTRGIEPEIAAEFVASAKATGAPLQIVDTLANKAAENYQYRCILVRPDHFVAWAGEPERGDARHIIARAIGA